MAKRRVQVNLHRDNGLPEDDAINVWHFDSDDPTNDTDSELADKVQGFYEDVQTLGYWSPNLSGEVTIKVYDMADPEPRVPTYMRDFDMGTPPASDGFPSEIAICLSMRAELEAGVNMARRRGRVFIGPIARSASTTEAGDVRIPEVVATNLIAAAQTNFNPSGSNQYLLAIYSPTTDQTGTLDDAFNDAKLLWVDNAFDVQRRRGSKATERFTGAINP